MKKIEQIIKNILLRLLLFFNRTPAASQIPEFGVKSRILFIRLNKIGDALVTTPLLKLIKDKTGAEITVLADEKNYFIFEDNPSIDNVFIYEKKFKQMLALRRKIDRAKFDAVVDLHDDVSTTVSFMIASLKIKYKFGLEKENKIIFTHTVEKPDPSSTHVVDRNLKLAHLFNINSANEKLNIQYKIQDSSEIRVQNFIKNKFPENKFLVGINISAGSESRFWGKERFRKLIKYFENFDVDLLLLCSTRDYGTAKDISSGKIKIYYSPSFNEFSAMISHLDFLFSPDTSIIHIASAFEVPVFGIYVKYNTEDMIWSPYKSKFEYSVTTESDFTNLNFEEVQDKLKPFFEKLYEQKRNS